MIIGPGIKIGSGITLGSPAYFGGGTNGSVHFNGTSHYLSIPDSTAFDQSGAFTIECWVYPTTTTGTAYVWSMLQHGFLCLRLADSGHFEIDQSYVGIQITSTNTYAANAWYHVALCSDGTTTSLYVNGVLEGTFNGTGGSTTDGNQLEIGNYAGGGNLYWPGNISNFRVVKGQAVYTAPFTPPTTNLSVISGTGYDTTLLLNTYYGQYFLYDSSINHFTVHNNRTTSSTLTPF